MLRLIPGRWRKREPWLLLAGFAVLSGVYGTLVHAVVQNGDAAVYTEQVANRVFSERAIHIGYVLLGVVFHAILPLQIDRAMNVMALTVGLGGALALYWAAKRLGSWQAGVGGVLLLLCASSYVRGMVLSEVDILSAGTLMISYALYLAKRTVLAGIAFGAAMLTTPVTASFLPLFVFTFAVDERGAWQTVRVQFLRLLCFGLVALVVYLPFVAWQWQSYVYGGRSLTTSSTVPFNAWKQVERGARFYMLNSWALLTLYLAAIVGALTDRNLWRRDQPVIGLALSVILTTLVADRTKDVPVHLAALPVLSLVSVLFLQRLASASKMVWAVPVVAFALMGPMAFVTTDREVDVHLKMRARYREMRDKSLPLRAMLVGFPEGFTNERFFEHYAYGISYTGLVPTLAEFRASLSQIRTGPEQFAIYFVHGIPADLRRALQDRYSATDRVLQGVNYHALVPRPHPP
ncbi:MAG: hypothetical protein ABI627_15185 [Polyangiaceae bacterium]